VAHEIEVKIEVDDAEATARRLEAMGAELRSPRRFEDNRLFDLADGALERSGGLLRLRLCDGRAVLTGKGPAPPAALRAGYKVRTEEETEVADPDALVRALAAAGLAARWRYQKYRREYRFRGATVVLDEIPHGVFVEIEGEPTAIDDVAAQLGFDRSAYLTATYRDIHAQRAGSAAGDMVFARVPGDAA
jgi:adenylate cyclase class 2